MYPTIKYVAELKHVREVSLVGTADLAFWKDRLRPAGLQPTEIGGGAQSMIGGIESRFLGVAFRGATISVFLSRHRGGSGRDGVFLARAFKPSRFFAFVERACFSSPYLHGQLRIDARRPASIEVARDDGIAGVHRGAGTRIGAARSSSRVGDARARERASPSRPAFPARLAPVPSRRRKTR
jgi:hypothetical protein